MNFTYQILKISQKTQQHFTEYTAKFHCVDPVELCLFFKIYKNLEYSVLGKNLLM